MKPSLPVVGSRIISASVKWCGRRFESAQQFNHALMIRDTQTGNEGFIYSQSEFFQEESDTRPGAKKSSRVGRGYYLMQELPLNSSRQAQLTRGSWFDPDG